MMQGTIRLYKPQINIAQSTSTRMWLISLCALFAIFQSSIRDNFSSLIIAIVCVITAIITEALIYFRTEKSGTIKDGSAIASALILALLLPNKINPIYAFMGSAFAMSVIKHSFGGLGANWLNPALGGWLFVRLSWTDVFNRALEQSPLNIINEGMIKNVVNPDGNPLGILRTMERSYGLTEDRFLDGLLKLVFDDGLFTFIKLEFPKVYIEFFNASAVGIIADRGVLVLLLGTVILSALKTKRSWIPAVYLGIYMILVKVFGALPFGGVLGDGDAFFGIFSGGIIVSAFLLSCEPSSGPKSDIGVLLITILGAFLSFLFRYRGAEIYGAFFAIALTNVLVPIIRDLEKEYIYRS